MRLAVYLPHRHHSPHEPKRAKGREPENNPPLCSTTTLIFVAISIEGVTGIHMQASGHTAKCVIKERSCVVIPVRHTCFPRGS